jgi:hypothetical protein
MKEVGIITLSELSDMAAFMYGNMVKAIVDVERGINLYPQKQGSDGSQGQILLRH